MSVAQIDKSRFTKHNGDRSSAAAVLQQVLQQPQPWWKQIFKLETLTVAGREVKGFVVPYWAAGVLLAAILGGTGYLYTSVDKRIDAKDQAYQDQRDLLIRLDERLKEKNERDKEKFEHIEKRFQNSDAVQTVLGRDIAKINAQRGN